jgi:hypothetical protein
MADISCHCELVKLTEERLQHMQLQTSGFKINWLCLCERAVWRVYCINRGALSIPTDDTGR